MTLDWFCSSLGIASAEMTPDVRAVMLSRAVEFLRVGRLSTLEYAALSRESKDVFLEASKTLRVELATMIVWTLASIASSEDDDGIDANLQAVLDGEAGKPA